MTRPDVYDHLRSVDADAAPGVYRVVGTPGDAVTLLRVADADGRRAHTGEVLSIDHSELDGFEPAENPDRNRPLTAAVASRIESFYWELRVLGRAVLDNPLIGGAALLAVAVGYLDSVTLPVPDVALVIAGVVALFYLARSGTD